MQPRISFLLLTILFIGMTVYAVIELLSGASVFSFIKVMPLLGPAIVAVLLKLRPYWPGIMLVSLLSKQALSLPLLDVFYFGYVLAMAITVFYFLEKAILKRRSEINNSSLRWMGLLFVALIARLVIEHPGSARLGTSGGLGQALYYTTAPLVGFVTAQLFAEKGMDLRKNLKFVVLFTLGLISYFTVINILSGLPVGQWTCFTYSFPHWMLFGCILTWFYLHERKSGSSILILAFSLFLIGFSLRSRFRMESLTTLVAMLLLAWVCRASLRTCLTPLLGIGLMLLVLNALPKSAIPAPIVRAASLYTTIERSMLDEQQLEFAGSLGWQDTFRDKLNAVAYLKLYAHPIWGEGWTFTFDEIVAAVSSDVQQGGLAMSGGFHNLILTLATKLGIPMTLAVCLLIICIMVGFVRNLRRHNSSYQMELFGGMLFFFTVIYLGFSVTNGAGQEVVGVFILSGAMLGLRTREAEARTQASLAATPRPALQAAV